MKAVLDTNVLISALLFPGGAPDRVFRAALRGHYELVVSPFIIQELARVLEEKFGYSAEEAGAVAGFVESIASVIVEPSEVPEIITSKKADNEILACALEARVDYLVTSDLKHIYPLQSVGNVRIVSPSEFLAILRSEGKAVLLSTDAPSLLSPPQDKQQQALTSGKLVTAPPPFLQTRTVRTGCRDRPPGGAPGSGTAIPDAVWCAPA